MGTYLFREWRLIGNIPVYEIKFKDGTKDISDRITEELLNTYYSGTYTIPDKTPDTFLGYKSSKKGIFMGWKTDDGTIYHKGQTITLTDDLTLTAWWEKNPVFVYGYIVNGNNESLSADTEIIKDTTENKTFTPSEHGNYITFGYINDIDEEDYEKDFGTPSKSDLQKEFDFNKATKYLTSAADARTVTEDFSNKLFTWEDVNSWLLKSANSATDYSTAEDVRTWHLDGKINVYKIEYDANGGNTSTLPVVDPDAYYCGTYTIGNAPTAPEGKTFAGWKVNGSAKADGTYYQGGDTLTLKKFGDTATITLEAQWKDKTPDPEVPKYPVYVYGYFTHGDNTAHLTRDITVNGKEIEWNEDANLLSPEYYITFGKIPEGTTEIPTTENQTTDKFNKAKLAELDNFDGTGSATTNVVPWTAVGNNWEALKTRPGAASYNDTGEVTEKDLTWHLDGAIKVYTVAYDDGVDDTSVTNMPTTPEGYYFFGDYTIKSEEPTRDGYNFLGWKLVGDTSDKLYKTSTENTTLTLTGDAVLVAQWQNATETPATYTVNYQWEGAHPNIALPGSTTTTDPDNITASPSTYNPIPGKDATGKDGIWSFNGWSNPNRNDDNKTITFIGTWNFTPSETKTITDVLNGRVLKSFKSQYGYSTEGTFTATAKVMSYQLEISSYTAEGDEPSDNNTNTPGTDNTKTFTGTVNLKTGDTKQPFTFSADKGVADVLEPRTHYEVWISEDKGNLSKVTYDTTKYILDFATGANSEVLPKSIHIWTGEDIAEGEEGKEPTPVEGTTITFKNIYTYKRHHSSGDSGNGGGKKEEKPTVEIKDDDALGLNNTDHFAYIVGYGNGEVRPQNSITRAEVASIFFRLLEDDVRDANYTRQNKFTDVSNDAWYCSAVSTLSAMGIISGYPDATFRPNASITRAEFAAIATRFDVNGDKTPASFNDIADHWAKDEIAVAANNGWVNGYEDGSFRPQNKITRAETMSLVNRVLNRKPETAEDLLENMAKWTDNADTNAWYYLAVQEATNSHYYEYKENSQYEKWTELRETRDWSELDK